MTIQYRFNEPVPKDQRADDILKSVDNLNFIVTKYDKTFESTLQRLVSTNAANIDTIKYGNLRLLKDKLRVMSDDFGEKKIGTLETLSIFFKRLVGIETKSADQLEEHFKQKSIYANKLKLEVEKAMTKEVAKQKIIELGSEIKGCSAEIEKLKVDYNEQIQFIGNNYEKLLLFISQLDEKNPLRDILGDLFDQLIDINDKLTEQNLTNDERKDLIILKQEVKENLIENMALLNRDVSGKMISIFERVVKAEIQIEGIKIKINDLKVKINDLKKKLISLFPVTELDNVTLAKFNKGLELIKKILSPDKFAYFKEQLQVATKDEILINKFLELINNPELHHNDILNMESLKDLGVKAEKLKKEVAEAGEPISRELSDQLLRKRDEIIEELNSEIQGDEYKYFFNVPLQSFPLLLALIKEIMEVKAQERADIKDQIKIKIVQPEKLQYEQVYRGRALSHIYNKLQELKELDGEIIKYRDEIARLEKLSNGSDKSSIKMQVNKIKKIIEKYEDYKNYLNHKKEAITSNIEFDQQVLIELKGKEKEFNAEISKT
ncbi:MAG: hypothetical protein H0W88_10105 [Parachlamydiaceae bacterium]|nr:hypothetical protein [Parachlamydiaceae bacterium]